MTSSKPDTQDARADLYVATVNDLWAGKAGNGDSYFAGQEFWFWWDNNWMHSVYREVENHGLVTPYGNAYDGIQDVTERVMDQYGFPAGGESAKYGNFIGKISMANLDVNAKAAEASLKAPETREILRQQASMVRKWIFAVNYCPVEESS